MYQSRIFTDYLKDLKGTFINNIAGIFKPCNAIV